MDFLPSCLCPPNCVSEEDLGWRLLLIIRRFEFENRFRVLNLKRLFPQMNESKALQLINAMPYIVGWQWWWWVGDKRSWIFIICKGGLEFERLPLFNRTKSEVYLIWNLESVENWEFCGSYLVYSQIWLNPLRDNGHFFLGLLVKDHNLWCKKIC